MDKVSLGDTLSTHRLHTKCRPAALGHPLSKHPPGDLGAIGWAWGSRSASPTPALMSPPHGTPPRSLQDPGSCSGALQVSMDSAQDPSPGESLAKCKGHLTAEVKTLLPGTSGLGPGAVSCPSGPVSPLVMNQLLILFLGTRRSQERSLLSPSLMRPWGDRFPRSGGA